MKKLLKRAVSKPTLFETVFSSELKSNFALQINTHKKYMKTKHFWLPTIYCALISLMAIITISIGYENVWQISFLAFLPTCFALVADVFKRMNKEISELRGQNDELQKKMCSTEEL